eukprot:2337479-Pyramimonas_sp.AAC.1
MLLTEKHHRTHSARLYLGHLALTHPAGIQPSPVDVGDAPLSWAQAGRRKTSASPRCINAAALHPPVS